MAGPEKKKKCPEGVPEYMLTYGDMVTLLLCFFVLMFTTATIDGYKMKLILSAFSGLGNYQGGNTLQAGQLAELGNTVMSLPSMQSGRALDNARKQAISIFEPEVKSQKIRITSDERGLVISLAGDTFFEQASAELNLEEARLTLQKLSVLLRGLPSSQTYRIEGHTDSFATDPTGPYPTNWELSSMRAINVLHYLADFGVNEAQFQVAGLADTNPLVDNSTPENRAYNRRVDVVILQPGHL